MRILLTTDTIGGVWTFTCELTEQLLQRGHYVALVSFGRLPDANQQAWCDRVSAQHGVSFACFASDAPLEWMQNNGAAFSGEEGLLLTIVSEFRVELIHSNQFCWGALSCDLPVVITAHSDVMSWAEACRPGGLEPSTWLAQYRALVQSGLRGANAVVSPTDWMTEALQKHFDVPCSVCTINNGRTLQPTYDEQPRKLQAVSVGRLWDEAKGVQTLLDIEPCLPILVAGEESFVGTATETRHLQALGVLNSEALHQLFRSSSIYIVTSTYEPFGLAPLEAVLCGCAVVSRDLESLREVWGDAALYFRTSEELEFILQTLTMNSEQLTVSRQQALMRAEQFTAERMANEYVELYESLFIGSASVDASTEEFAAHAG